MLSHTIRRMTGRSTPLYVVCSPCRCVGKTLVSRLLAEFHVLDGRPVAAFDLADEGPQLADYLPSLTTIADIGDMRGQMALFDRLIDNDDGAKIIDVSHRAFKNFFTVVREIGFSEEARRRCIEPRVLFILDADPKSVEAHASLQRSFVPPSLLPVRNQIAAGAKRDDAAPAIAGIAPATLDIPLLGFSLRALIDRQSFSFSEFWKVTPADLADALVDELQDWMERVFLQIRELERSITGEEAPARVAAPRSRRPRAADRRRFEEALPTGSAWRQDMDRAAGGRHTTDIPEPLRKFAPKKMRRSDGDPLDQSGDAIVAKLRTAGGRLRAAEDRIDQLEAEIEQVHARAVRAETWLEVIRKEIEERLIAPAAAGRPKPVP
jgi:hypothetical protein